jgi:hypothetical protein
LKPLAGRFGPRYRPFHDLDQKVMVDLFDRRLRLFRQGYEAMRPIMSSGSTRENELVFFAFVRDAQFHFGREVDEYLEKMRSEVISRTLAETMKEATPDRQEGVDWIRDRHKHFMLLMTFYDDWPTICEPYLRMDQRHVRSPRRLVLDLLRLSKPLIGEQKPEPPQDA